MTEAKQRETDSKEVNVEPDNNMLTVLEKGQKPWYLTTTEIYKIVKGTVKIIPHSQDLFERSLKAIELIAKYVNESTRLKVAFDPEQSYDLVNRLDDILTEQLVVVDDGFDTLRSKFCSSLRSLIGALSAHQQWAKTYVITQQDSVKEAVTVRYDHAIVLVKLLLEQAELRFPKASQLVTTSVERVKTTVETGKQIYQGKVPDSVVEITAKVLSDAQPYVHNAVNYSRPLVDRVVEVSQPYYERSAPYLTPLLDRAQQLEFSLKENAYVGSYATTAIDTSRSLVTMLVEYAIPSPATPPVVATIQVEN